MSLLFAFAAAVQWNDPDPLLWIAAYAGVALLAGAHAFANQWRPVACFGAASLLLLWSLTLVGNLTEADAEAFTSFAMSSAVAEQARECLGLLLCAAYLFWLGVRPRGLRSAPAALPEDAREHGSETQAGGDPAERGHR